MSYDLAVWDGARPESDEAATATFLEFMDAMEAGYDEPPLPSIAEYVDVLTSRWREDPPWLADTATHDAVGPLCYFHLDPSRSEEAVAFATLAAESQGLVCFDPQTEQLL